MARANLDGIRNLMSTGEEIVLTEAQYKNSTGADLPKGNYYLKNKSVLSRVATENGYEIEIVERTVILRKR